MLADAHISSLGYLWYKLQCFRILFLQFLRGFYVVKQNKQNAITILPIICFEYELIWGHKGRRVGRRNVSVNFGVNLPSPRPPPLLLPYSPSPPPEAAYLGTQWAVGYLPTTITKISFAAWNDNNCGRAGKKVIVEAKNKLLPGNYELTCIIIK